MIKDMIETLQKMEFASPAPCEASLQVGLTGNLVLLWRYRLYGEAQMFKQEITPECDDNFNDAIDNCINYAKNKMKV
jgi:hypothetical protein